MQMPIDSNSTTSSQDAVIRWEKDDTVETLAGKINDALALITDDAQRIISRQDRLRTSSIEVPASGYRTTIPMAGTASVIALSDTATTSDNANYHTLTLYRNGAAANTITIQTRYKELPAYLNGVPLGTVAVSVGDVLAINLSTTGAPTALTTANLLIRVTVTPDVSPVVNR